MKSSSCVLSDKETKILNIIHKTLSFVKKQQSQFIKTAVTFLFCCLSSAPCLYRQSIAIQIPSLLSIFLNSIFLNLII